MSNLAVWVTLFGMLIVYMLFIAASREPDEKQFIRLTASGVILLILFIMVVAILA